MERINLNKFCITTDLNAFIKAFYWLHKIKYIFQHPHIFNCIAKSADSFLVLKQPISSIDRRWEGGGNHVLLQTGVTANNAHLVLVRGCWLCQHVSRPSLCIGVWKSLINNFGHKLPISKGWFVFRSCSSDSNDGVHLLEKEVKSKYYFFLLVTTETGKIFVSNLP